MKLTSLTIAPTMAYRSISEGNPLRAVVKLEGDKSTVECVLSNESMMRMLDLCAEEIAAQAKQRVDEFTQAVCSIDGCSASKMIGET